MNKLSEPTDLVTRLFRNQIFRKNRVIENAYSMTNYEPDA